MSDRRRPSRATGRGAGRALGIVGLLLVALVAAAPGAEAASPAVSPTPEIEPHAPVVKVWLDRALPATVQPGTTLEVGGLLWNADDNLVTFAGTAIFVRAVGADGVPAKVRNPAIQDWRGHYAGRVEVPTDGLSGVEFGQTGTMCENDVCASHDSIFPLGGIGPPPGAALTSIATAMIDPPIGPLVAGQPLAITVRVRLNADWSGAFVYPPTLVIRVRQPRGPDIATSPLELSPTRPGTYEGSLTIPASGDLVIEAATDREGGDATRFGLSLRPITVEPASSLSLPADPRPGLVPLLAAGLAVSLGAGMLVVRRRRGDRSDRS